MVCRFPCCPWSVPGPVFGDSHTFNLFLAGLSTSAPPQSQHFAMTLIGGADRAAAPARPARRGEVAGSPAPARPGLAR